MDKGYRAVRLTDVIAAKNTGIFRLKRIYLPAFMEAMSGYGVSMLSTTRYRGWGLADFILEDPTSLVRTAQVDYGYNIDGLLILSSVTPGEKSGIFGQPSGQQGPHVWAAKLPFETNIQWVYVVDYETPKRAAQCCITAVHTAMLRSAEFRKALFVSGRERE